MFLVKRGPPPINVLQLPPGISIEGSLPPWPQITIGPDHLPTYSSEPDQCQTETASLCATTSSIGPSATSTISTCAPLIGCSVTSSATTSTTSASCASATVTDYVVLCETISGSGEVTSCSTISTTTVSGCSGSVTASTSTTVEVCQITPSPVVTSSVSISELYSFSDPWTSTFPNSFPTMPSSLPLSGLPTSTATMSTTSTTSSSSTPGSTSTSTSQPFPTLTTAWTTPSGSTCASTATFTSCNFEGGGVGVCVPTSTCADWVGTSTTSTTSSTSPTGPTQTPLSITQKRCYDGSEFPGAAGHIDSYWQADYIVPWSCAYEDTAPVDQYLGPGDAPIVFHTITNNEPYFYSISWIDGCTTSESKMYVWQPIPGDTADTCETIMRGNYENCQTDPGYAGGWVVAGCLKYVFQPCDPSKQTCDQ
ncbi:hypothetical protein QBC46DRAFT_420765 [Diplogelasinospora grovesii]|uniref:Uncharacterized protein n=1 Tax=Diplogelasinospora grovesii TaxID=303347 RepID=A0AAN6S855_9PEZI|nr:hypothetical protein QBC46DRAFT_420765 [Diplogelasinospora grovesii]